MSITQPSAAAGPVRSADGTTIGYRRTGDGPGVVLVHGGGQSSQNLMSLAAALSDRFTVYVPDRRGRGMSGPYREDHGAVENRGGAGFPGRLQRDLLVAIGDRLIRGDTG